MKTILEGQFRSAAVLLLTGLVLAGLGVSPAQAELYELRVYTTEDGKLDDLHARFKNHTIGIFERLGMKVHQFWTPAEGPEAENTLYYILSFESKEARDAAWKAFSADEEWQRVYKESQKNGKLVKKVDSTFLNLTDYSPKK